MNIFICFKQKEIINCTRFSSRCCLFL